MEIKWKKIRKHYSALIEQHKNPTANNKRIKNKTKEKPPEFLKHTNLKKLNIKQYKNYTKSNLLFNSLNLYTQLRLECST